MARLALHGLGLVILGGIGAVLDLERIALVKGRGGIGELAAVDGTRERRTTALLEYLPIDGEEVAGLRGHDALVYDIAYRSAIVHRACHAVDRHVVGGRVQIEVHADPDAAKMTTATMAETMPPFFFPFFL